MWLVTCLSTHFDLLLFAVRGTESLQCQSTKAVSPGEAEGVGRQMDHRPGRRDEGNERSTFLTSLLIATLIILAPNEKPRVINHSKAGEAAVP